MTFNNTYETLLDSFYTQEMLNILKNDYIHSKGSDKGFTDYVSSLRSKESIEKEQEEICKSMVNLAPPSFKLLNTKGEEANLEKQKGKIVAIDFWATWCYLIQPLLLFVSLL